MDSAGDASGTASASMQPADDTGNNDSPADGETQTGGGAAPGIWCVDDDADGFGDPEDCQASETPIAGSVDNDDDCDDTSANTFPGAAPNDDLQACMRDDDGDDWGAQEPMPGVTAGTDCLDNHSLIFPGAAEYDHPPGLCAEDEDEDGWGDDQPPLGAEAGHDCADNNPYAYPDAAEYESPPGLCTVDADEDGWGDVNPDDPGAVSGHDCYDGNAALNPDALQLSTLLPSGGDALAPRTLATIDPLTASVEAILTLESPMGDPSTVDISTATINGQGQIVTNDLASVQLHTISYDGACMVADSEIAPIGGSYGLPGDILCGLEFGSGGLLYGIDHDDYLLTFDVATGQVIGSIPIETLGIPLNIQSCGMAYDCVEDRLLVANGINHSIYDINTTTGIATNLRDLGAFFEGPWDPVGFEYEVVTGDAYISTGEALYRVGLDGIAPPQFIDSFGQEVSNLQHLPICE